MATDIFPIQPIAISGIIRLSLMPEAYAYRYSISTFLDNGKFQKALEQELRQLTDSFSCRELKLNIERIRPDNDRSTVRYKFQIHGDLKLQEPLFNIVPTSGGTKVNLRFNDYINLDELKTLIDQATSTALFAAEETFLKNKDRRFYSWKFLGQGQHMFNARKTIITGFLDEFESDIIRTCVPLPEPNSFQKTFDVLVIGGNTLANVKPEDRSTTISVINDWFNVYKETADVPEEKKKLAAAILTKTCHFPIEHDYNEAELNLLAHEAWLLGRDDSSEYPDKDAER